MASTNEINARAVEKRADGFMKATLTRWKPDFERAAELYEEAARTFRASSAHGSAANAEEKCARAWELMDNHWYAAKAYERATEALSKMNPVDGAAVFAMAEQANEAYARANRAQNGAESLSRAAGFMEKSDLKVSAALLRRSLEILEEEGKDVYASEHHRKLVAILLRAELYQDAATACLKYAESCSRAGQMNSLAKAYLSAIVALLYDGDSEGAQSTFSDIHEVPGFENSAERETAYLLLSAYREASAEKIKSALNSSSCVKFLDIPFARLAQRLPNPQHELGAVAVKMGVDEHTGDTTDEDDLT